MKATPETSIDDIIENILTNLNTIQIGGCVDVTNFVARMNHGYDRGMEPRVREKMYEFGVAKPCTGSNQPETAIMLTPKGAKVYESGGWKNFLNQVERSAQAANLAKYEKEKQDRRSREEELEINRISGKAAVRSANAAWFAGIISAVAVVFSLFQFWESRSQSSELNLIKKELKSLDSLLKVQQKGLLQTNNRLDSLPTRKDWK